MKRFGIVLCLLLTLVVAAPEIARFWDPELQAQQNPVIQMAVDTAVPDQDGVLTLYGAMPTGGSIGLPVAAGDLNGDGLADVAFSEMYANAGSSGRVNNGQVNIYLSDGNDSGIVDASTQPSPFFTVIGQRSGDLLGASTAISDVNGDGFADLLIAATGSSGSDGARTGCGAVYVFPGSKNFSTNADLQTPNNMPPPGVTAIYGPQAGCRLGIWIGVGDVDGDGIPDLLIGADQLNTSGGFHTGGAFIIFGSPSLPSVIDLASPPAGVRITTVIGANTEDHWGSCIYASDLNGDGIADLVISAALDRESANYVNPQDQTTGEGFNGAQDNGLRPNCGEVYVLYGEAAWPSQIDLRTPPSGSTHVIGANPFDFLGSQLFSADINGDGKPDLIIGAIQALAPDPVSTSLTTANPLDYTPPSTTGRTGAVYIVYGSAQLQGATIDMLNPSASGLQVAAIYGEENLDCAGDSVRAYDINNDGMAELFIGSPNNTFTVDGVQRVNAGDTKIIFGQPDFLPPVIKMYDPPSAPTIYRIAGAHGVAQGLDGGDQCSYRLTGADVDGDGYTDYIVNAMRGDGPNNSVMNAGQVYILSGRKLSQKLGIPITLPAPTLTRASLSSNGLVVSHAPAGQSGLTITVDGAGFGPNAVFTVNGTPVTFHATASGEVTINLDENLAVRNTAGQLSVQSQNTSPASALSNIVMAGTLTGPQISSASLKVKPSGVKAVLAVSGQGFAKKDTLSVTNSQGQAVSTKAVNLINTGTLQTKITGQTFTSGSVFKVRVLMPSGVMSNQVTVTLP
jgi:hypothetical protein